MSRWLREHRLETALLAALSQVMTSSAASEGAAPGRSWTLTTTPLMRVGSPAALMGIINVTPDSFSDGGRHAPAGSAVAAGTHMVASGAAWLDVGGESSRPGATPVSPAQQIARIGPVITGLRAAGISAPISVDTASAQVARHALDAGASAINDITAGSDPGMFPLVAERGCPLILMHMQGTPLNMQVAPHYADVVEEVLTFLAERMRLALASGIALERLLIDPGIGFGKTVAHNCALLRALPRLVSTLARPLVVGISRKSFIGHLAASDPAAPLPIDGRDAAGNVMHGLISEHCALLRVHDVPGARMALQMAAALRTPLGGEGGRDAY